MFSFQILQVDKVKQEKLVFIVIKALGKDFICFIFSFKWRVVKDLNVVS